MNINLLTLLNNTQLQQEDVALYNVISVIIKELIRLDTVKISRDDIIQTGVWTAIDNSGAGLTLTTAASKYIKTDKLVVASIQLVFPVTASGAVAIIGNLPFIAERTLAGSGLDSVIIGYQDTTLDIYARVIMGSNNIGIVLNTAVGVTNAQLSAKTLRLTAVYFTSL